MSDYDYWAENKAVEHYSDLTEKIKKLERENEKLRACLGFSPEIEKANLSHKDALVILEKIHNRAQECLTELEAGSDKSKDMVVRAWERLQNKE